MKLTIFIFAVGLCLAVTSANDGSVVDNVEVNEIFSDNYVGVETFGIFNFFKATLKAALRTVRGVHCCVEAAIKMSAAATKFIEDVEKCGDETCKQTQILIDSCNDIINTVNDIVNLNEQLCNGEGETAPFKCSHNLFVAMYKLMNQIERTIKLTTKIPQTGSDATVCVYNASTALSNTLMQFPSFINECSKL